MRVCSLGDRPIVAIGAGDVSLARAAARGIDAGEVARGVNDAIGAGLELIEVADEEAAERLVGDAVRELRARDRVVVACRVPQIEQPIRDVLSERLPAAYVQHRIEASLRATRLDALPLAQLPVRAAWRESSAWPELRGTCARLVHEGKVLRWGAVVAPDDLGIVDEDWLVAIQVPLNLRERTAQPLVAAALAKRLAVLARRPLAGGVLAGTLGPGVKLALNDDRRDLDLEAAAVTAARLAALVEREPPAARSCDAARAQLARNPRHERECVTAAELALRFVIDRGAIALPRLHRREHIAEAVLAVAAAPLRLDTGTDVQ